MKTISRIIFISGLGLCLLQEGIRANPLEAYGAGYTLGTAGSGTATVRDWTASYYNPAGMSHPAKHSRPLKDKRPLKKLKIESSEDSEAEPKANSLGIAEGETNFVRAVRGSAYPTYMGLGYMQVVPAMQLNLNGGSHHSRVLAGDARDVPAYGFIKTGLNYDLRNIIEMPYDIPLVFGTLLALSADGTISAAPDLNEKTYNFKKAGNNVQVLGATFGLSLQPWKRRLSIGFSPGNQILIEGNAEIKNITLDSKKPVKFDAVADAKTEPAPIVGMVYTQPMPRGSLHISAVYRAAVKVTSDLDLKTELPLGITQEQTVFARNEVTPHTGVLGVAYEWSRYQAMVDIEYQAWSAIRLNPARAQNESPLNYNDIIALRLGGEARLDHTKFLRRLGLTTRAGFAYIPAFTPEQNGNANYLDNDKTVYSIGFRRWLKAVKPAKFPMIIDVSFSWQHWAARSADKAQSSPLPDGSNQPNYTYGGDIFVMALTLNWKI